MECQEKKTCLAFIGMGFSQEIESIKAMHTCVKNTIKLNVSTITQDVVFVERNRLRIVIFGGWGAFWLSYFFAGLILILKQQIIFVQSAKLFSKKPKASQWKLPVDQVSKLTFQAANIEVDYPWSFFSRASIE